MSSWNAAWHQALTVSPFGGILTGKNKTAVFSVHVPSAASGIRMRFNNIFGSEEYRFGSVTVVCEGKILPVTVGGKREFGIPVGSRIFSDPVNADIPAGSDVEIRIWYLSRVIDFNQIEEDARSFRGDATQNRPNGKNAGTNSLLKKNNVFSPVPSIDLIEMLTEEKQETIVAFGDSITALSQWTKPLGERLEKKYGGKYVLLNSGISGNCLLYEPKYPFGEVFGEKGVERFSRDVLELDNVRTVIFALGVNDVSYFNDKTKDVINVSNFISTLEKITNELHSRGIRVVMPTITPRFKVARIMGVYTQEMEDMRLELNKWIRITDIFDYVVDQEAVVRDEDENGYFFKEGLHQGDHLHPNAKGGKLMAEAYDLAKLIG